MIAKALAEEVLASAMSGGADFVELYGEITRNTCKYLHLQDPLKHTKMLKVFIFYILCYKQTSPLDVPMYAFGQTKSSLPS